MDVGDMTFEIGIISKDVIAPRESVAPPAGGGLKLPVLREAV